jgi:hypothetical protein
MDPRKAFHFFNGYSPHKDRTEIIDQLKIFGFLSPFGLAGLSPLLRQLTDSFFSGLFSVMKNLH